MEEARRRRAEDLSRRARRTGAATHTKFLTPAEVHDLRQWAPHGAEGPVLFFGGYPGAERQIACFLPDWMEPEALDPADFLCALEVHARFGAPGHRDVLGAALALGIEREWLGDILVDGERAWLYCLPSVKEHLLLSLTKVGRWGVRTRELPLADVPVPIREREQLRFSVSSPRLDAVCAGLFRLSRATAAGAVAQGLVQLNDQECLKPDAQIRSGDVLSLRGKGKGTITRVGDGQSRKGRLFILAELAR